MAKMKDFQTTVQEDGILWAAADLLQYRDVVYYIYCSGFADEHIKFRGNDKTLYVLESAHQGDDDTLVSLRLTKYNDEPLDIGYVAHGIDQCFNLVCSCIELAEGLVKWNEIEVKPVTETEEA